MDYKARSYDPFLQKFIQPDTVVANPYSSQGYNRYAYVNNNPIRYNDPSGNRPIDCEKGDLSCFSNSTKQQNNSIDSNTTNGKTIENDLSASQSSVNPATILLWLSINVNWVWRHPPMFLEGMFKETGRRILTVDHPHPGIGVDYYHINTDIKFLRGIDHKNIEPFIKAVLGLANSYVYTVSTMSETIAPFIIITEQQFKSLPVLPSSRQE